MSVLLFLLLLASDSGIVANSPERACSLLSRQGLSTGEYKYFDGFGFGCISDYKTVNDDGNRFRKENTVTYSAYGDQNTVKRLELNMTIANESDAIESRKHLIELTSLLLINASFEALPEDALNAILRKESIKLTIGKTTLSIHSEDYGNGISGINVKIQ